MFWRRDRSAPSCASTSLARIRAALRDTLPGPAENADRRVAAVAAVLREWQGEVELLFIRRAKRAGDPWSGHMAWPGGKRERGDADMVACAIRETREEVGLELSQAGELIGGLRPWRQERAGPKGLYAVVPYVFALSAPVELRPGAEVQEAVWVPLSYFTLWSTRRPWSLVAPLLPQVPPAYRYEGRFIWGLTLWMLADLLRRLDELQVLRQDAIRPGDHAASNDR